MTASRFRAWKFAIGAMEAETSSGLAVTAAGRMAMVEGEASVRQAILLLLSTTPGERVMRPEYGCALRRLIFSPNDDTTAGLAMHYVREALQQWEPRIEVLGLDARRDEATPDRLDILLRYRVKSTRETGQLIYPLDLTGARA